MAALRYLLRGQGWVALTQCDGHVTYPTLDGTDDRCPCMYFARCDREAVTTVANPVLGDVPCCLPCARFGTS
jgi:hypothetical protein